MKKPLTPYVVTSTLRTILSCLRFKKYIFMPDSANDIYKVKCNRVVQAASSKGVAVLLKPWPSIHRLLWDREN
jgi:hypothetical protein